MRDYFRSRSTTQLPPTVDNFRQHLLHHSTLFIAFSMNELRKGTSLCQALGQYMGRVSIQIMVFSALFLSPLTN